MKQNDQPADEVQRLKTQLRNARKKLRVLKSQKKQPQVLTVPKKPVESVQPPTVATSTTNGRPSLLTILTRAALQRTKEELDELLKAS